MMTPEEQCCGLSTVIDSEQEVSLFKMISVSNYSFTQFPRYDIVVTVVQPW